MPRLRGRLTGADVDELLAEVERWVPRWRRHLHRDDNLDELLQCARIASWLNARGLALRKRWHVGMCRPCALFGWRKAWDWYRAESNYIAIGSSRCKPLPLDANGEVCL